MGSNNRVVFYRDITWAPIVPSNARNAFASSTNRYMNEGMHSLPVLLSEQNLRFARMVSDRVVIIEGGIKKYVGNFVDHDAQPEIRKAYLSV